jgi:hypothetical protein
VSLTTDTKNTRQEDNGCTVYELEFKDSVKNPIIKVAESGTPAESLQKYWSQLSGLNRRPAVYKTAALPLS